MHCKKNRRKNVLIVITLYFRLYVNDKTIYK